MGARKKKPATDKDLLAGTKKLQTVGDWLRFAVTCFTRAPLAFVQGLHGPQEEAMFLVGRFLGIDTADLVPLLGARLTRGEIVRLGALIRRRVTGHVPVPYLVGEAVLGDAHFAVDERVLIPRSYIAALLPDTVRHFAGRGWTPRRILDLGTGSGCLAILAARAFPDAVVDAVDVDADALQVAQLNITSHGLDERVHALQSDLFNALPAQRYDLILANPPYEPSAVLAAQPPEIAHEPALALDGGPDGLTFVRRIVQEARSWLSPRGVLVVELGGLRSALATEFPGLTAHVFPLPDGTDAVIGLRARQLPAAAAS